MQKYLLIAVLAFCTVSAVAQQRGTLAGNWRVVHANTKRMHGISLKFSADGHYSVRGGCNTVEGDYRANAAGSLKMSETVYTEMVCRRALMEADEHMRRVAARAASYQTDGRRLTVFDRKGRIILTAERLPESIRQ